MMSKVEIYDQYLDGHDKLMAEAKKMAAIVTQAGRMLEHDPASWRFQNPARATSDRRQDEPLQLDDEARFIEQSTWPTIQRMEDLQRRIAAAHESSYVRLQ